MQVGSKFETINGLKKVFGDEDAEIVQHEGEVILLDFWATWCPPCQAPMAHNQEMLKNHSEGDDAWTGVRIIGISLD